MNQKNETAAEAKMPAILSDWLREYSSGTLTWEQLEQRLMILTNLSISNACNNAVTRIIKAYRYGCLTELCNES